MRDFRFIAGLEREGHERQALNADDIESVKERTYYAVYCRIDLGEFVDVHSQLPTIVHCQCIRQYDRDDDRSNDGPSGEGGIDANQGRTRFRMTLQFCTGICTGTGFDVRVTCAVALFSGTAKSY